MSKIINNLHSCAGWNNSVVCFGHFSTIHLGHIRYLKRAKIRGEKLLVALIGDKDEKFPFSQIERAEALMQVNIADAIYCLEASDLKPLIKQIQPSLLVLGNEYKDIKSFQSTIKCQLDLGGEVEFHAGEINYASSDLLVQTQKDLKNKRRQEFLEACRRLSLTKTDLLSCINQWQMSNIVVLGDCIVDQFAACEAVGLSAEAPVVVVRELEHRNFAGGAAIVASHIRALGAKCTLISIVGDDIESRFIKDLLKSQSIDDQLIIDKSRPTTFKKRYIVENQKLFRVSKLEEKSVSAHIEELIIKKLDETLKVADALVISDFVYGVVTPRVLKSAIEIAKRYNTPIVGDLQCSSQVGNVAKFNGFSLICPNEREARLALQDKESSIEQLSQKLLFETSSKSLIMKLGSDGFIVYCRTKDNQIVSQPFPALSANPIDVSGAGDSLLSVMAIGLASGQEVMECAAIGCCMASRAVEIMGNIPVSSSDLTRIIQEQFYES